LTKGREIRIVARFQSLPIVSKEIPLANTAQARKRARQAEAHRDHNASLRSVVRTYIKKVLKAVQAKDKNVAQQAYREATSVIDRVAAKGVLHKNAAARHKSRLNERVRAL
jgi:small subunit ribosomal protein S20